MRNLFFWPPFLLLLGCTHTSTKPPSMLAPATKLAIFDIDGTLTPTQNSINTVRENAPAAVRAYADAGYRVIYLSARFPLFQYNIADFLEKHNFPEGDVHVPTWSQVFTPHDEFKTSVLNHYSGADWSQSYGFGDSDTDYAAYANVNIPQQQIIGLKRTNTAECETGAKADCLADWSGPLPGIRQ